MPTKTQAKTSIDTAAAAIKADIDNVLPVGVNITDGNISFAPTKWIIKMDAGASQATGDSWATTISTNLTSAGRTFSVTRAGRRLGETVKNIVIDSQLATYFIVNLG